MQNYCSLLLICPVGKLKIIITKRRKEMKKYFSEKQFKTYVNVSLCRLCYSKHPDLKCVCAINYFGIYWLLRMLCVFCAVLPWINQVFSYHSLSSFNKSPGFGWDLVKASLLSSLAIIINCYNEALTGTFIKWKLSSGNWCYLH